MESRYARSSTSSSTYRCCRDIAFRYLPWLTSSNASIGDAPERSFRVTHPFHPLHGREFPLVAYRHSWGLDRVYFYDDNGQLACLSACWTSVSPPDPFVALSAGRSAFRAVDLLDLVRLISQMQEGGTK